MEKWIQCFLILMNLSTLMTYLCTCKVLQEKLIGREMKFYICQIYLLLLQDQNWIGLMATWNVAMLTRKTDCNPSYHILLFVLKYMWTKNLANMFRFYQIQAAITRLLLKWENVFMVIKSLKILKLQQLRRNEIVHMGLWVIYF